jgi:hypothetical protein
MKKLMLMLSLALLVGAAQAQEGPKVKSPEERAAQKAGRIGQQYGLSADQQARLTPELVKTELTLAQKQAAAKAARQELEQAQAAQQAAIEAVLTPEQLEKYRLDKKHKKEQQRKRKGERGQRPGWSEQR